MQPLLLLVFRLGASPLLLTGLGWWGESFVSVTASPKTAWSLGLHGRSFYLLSFHFYLFSAFTFPLFTFYLYPFYLSPCPTAAFMGIPCAFLCPPKGSCREAEKGQTCHCPWEPSSSTETCTWHQQRADCLEQEQGRMGAAPWMDVPMSLCLAGWHSSLTISLCQAAPLGSAH